MSAAISRPILTLHVGQAGIQIGHAAWELLCLEHNIEMDGVAKWNCGDFGNVDTMFLSTPNGTHYPRSIFVDTDPFCVDEIRTGPYRGLFNSRQLISDHIDSGLNYATGRYGFVKSLLPETIDRLRWLTEKSDIKSTVILIHSACGGTGSGFAVSLLTGAAEELGLLSRSTLDICVIPGQTAAQNSCELLNSALYLDESQLLARQTFCISNSALFRVCSSQLLSNGRATYAHINRIVAAAFSNLTATERLPGSTVTLQSLLDSLLPFEYLKYPTLACASFLTADLAKNDQTTGKSVTSAVIDASSQFLDIDPRMGRHAAGFLLYRGHVNMSEAQKLAAELTAKGHVTFHDWAPAGFRSGVVAPPPLAPPNSGFISPAVSVTMLTCHSSVAEVFSRLSATAKRLHDADLFIHSYEGALVALLSREKISSIAAIGAVSGSANNSMEIPTTSRTSQDLSHWMSGRGAQQGQQQQQQPQSEQQQQQLNRTSMERQRTGVSDVFGVRLRLSSAISYLNKVAVVYASEKTSFGASSTSSQSQPNFIVDNQGTMVIEPLSADRLALKPPVKLPAADVGLTDVGVEKWYEHLGTDEDSASSLPHDKKSESSHQQQKEQKQQSHYQPLTSTGSNSADGSQPSWWSRLQVGASLRKAANHFSLMLRRQGVRRAPASAADGCAPASSASIPESEFSWTPRLEAANQSEQLDCDSSIAIAEAQCILLKYQSELLESELS